MINLRRRHASRGKTVENIVALYYSPIVQLVEHLTVNQYVAGSSPAWGANNIVASVVER